MRVHRNVYAAAYKASRLDKSNRSNAASLETEWANVINAVNSSNHRPAEVSARGSLATATVPASAAGKFDTPKENSPLLATTSKKPSASYGSNFASPVQPNQGSLFPSTSGKQTGVRNRVFDLR